MLNTLINAWKIADLRKKILYTLFILFLFRLGCAIPVPFIDITILLKTVEKLLHCVDFHDTSRMRLMQQYFAVVFLPIE